MGVSVPALSTFYAIDTYGGSCKTEQKLEKYSIWGAKT